MTNSSVKYLPRAFVRYPRNNGNEMYKESTFCDLIIASQLSTVSSTNKKKPQTSRAWIFFKVLYFFVFTLLLTCYSHHLRALCLYRSHAAKQGSNSTVTKRKVFMQPY